jgi:hypothetical protein
VARLTDRILPALLAAHLAVVLRYAVVEPAVRVRPFTTAVVAVATALLAGALAWKLPPVPRTGRVLGAAIALFLVSRAAWLDAVDTLPISDFAGYEAIAAMVARGGPIEMPWKLGSALASWGYPIALGQVWRWIPDTAARLEVAKLCNLALGCLSLVLLHRVARLLAGARAAVLAAILFVLWPGQCYLTSVLATEHLAVPLLLLAALLGLGVVAPDAPAERERSASSGVVRALLAGLVLAAAVAVRSALASAPLAFLVATFRGRPRGSRLALAIALVAGVVLGTAGYRGALQAAYGAVPRNAVWWTLLTGTSAESGGSFSKSDRDRFFAQRSFDDANAVARAEVVRRVGDDPVALAELAWWKTVRLWLADDYAVGWATERVGPSSRPPPRDVLDALAQGFHIAALVLALVGCARLALRATASPGIDLVLLLLLFGTLLHAATESQARYHYPWQPWIFVLGAIGAVGPPPSPARRPLGP